MAAPHELLTAPIYRRPDWNLKCCSVSPSRQMNAGCHPVDRRTCVHFSDRRQTNGQTTQETAFDAGSVREAVIHVGLGRGRPLQRCQFAALAICNSSVQSRLSSIQRGGLAGRPSASPVRFSDATETRVSSLVGNVKENLAPRGGLSAAHNRPPCDSTMERLIRSPIPVP